MKRSRLFTPLWSLALVALALIGPGLTLAQEAAPPDPAVAQAEAPAEAVATEAAPAEEAAAEEAAPAPPSF